MLHMSSFSAHGKLGFLVFFVLLLPVGDGTLVAL